MSTKKQAKPADLPTKTKSTYVRPSRSKTAVAARAAAQDAIDAKAAEWLTGKLTDEGLAVTALGDGQYIVTESGVPTIQSGDLPIAPAAPAAAGKGRTYFAFVDADDQFDTVTPAITTEDLALEHEIQVAVAALDVDVETVRSLADAGLGDDEFVEEAAVDRIRRAQAVKLELENAERQPNMGIGQPLGTDFRGKEQWGIAFVHRDDGIAITNAGRITGSDAYVPAVADKVGDDTYTFPHSEIVRVRDFLNTQTSALDTEFVPGEGHLHPEVHAYELCHHMNGDSVPIIQKEYWLDERSADGTLFIAVGSQAVIDMIDRFIPDEGKPSELAAQNGSMRRLFSDVVELLVVEGLWVPPAERDIDHIDITQDWSGVQESLEAALVRADEHPRLVAEIADMKAAYSASLSAAHDATSTALADLTESRSLLEKAKADATEYLRDLKAVRQMLAEADYRTLRLHDKVSELGARRPFWARVKAVFVDPNGKKGAR